MLAARQLAGKIAGTEKIRIRIEPPPGLQGPVHHVIPLRLDVKPSPVHLHDQGMLRSRSKTESFFECCHRSGPKRFRPGVSLGAFVEIAIFDIRANDEGHSPVIGQFRFPGNAVEPFELQRDRIGPIGQHEGPHLQDDVLSLTGDDLVAPPGTALIIKTEMFEAIGLYLLGIALVDHPGPATGQQVASVLGIIRIQVGCQQGVITAVELAPVGMHPHHGTASIGS